MNRRILCGLVAIGFFVTVTGLASTLSDKPATAKVDSKVTLPIWWNSDSLPEITKIDDCAIQWTTWRPKPSKGSDFYSVPMSMPSGTSIEAKTCAEWAECVDAGGCAYSTYALSMESWFLERSLAFLTIPHLQPSSHSGFFGKPWSEYAADFLDEDDDWQEDGKVHHAGGHILHGKWSVDFKCDEDNEDCFDQESATVLARGDYDGDGWEDMIVSTAKMSVSGSGRYYYRRMFTRRQSGRVLDTSNRLLLDRALSPVMMTEMRAQLKQGFGVPQGVPISLSGTMDMEGQAHPFTMDLKFDDGFASGTYSLDDSGKTIEVEGSLGFGRTLWLNEFALGEHKNAKFFLSVSIERDEIKVSGLWGTHGDVNRLTLVGHITPEPKSY